jgi:hypothetical protein
MLPERVRAGLRRWCPHVRRSSRALPSCSPRASTALAPRACKLPHVVGGSAGSRRCPGRPSLTRSCSIWTCCCFRTHREALRRGPRRPDLRTACALMILFLRGTFAARSRIARQPSYRLLLGARAANISPSRWRSSPEARAKGRVSHCRSPPCVTSSRCGVRGDPTQTGAPEAPAGLAAGRLCSPRGRS